VQSLVMFGPAAGYGLYRAQYTQRVLAAGYSLEDIRLALRERALQQREELAFESAAEPPLVARVIRTLTFVAFGVAAGSGLLLAVLPWRWDWMNMGGVLTGLWTAFGLGALATVTGGLIGRAVPGRRLPPKDPLKGLRVRLWGGRLGEWFTRIAGLGMDRKALPAASAHRPTEIAIGIAASSLYEALPKETRKGLPDLPDVLRKLEGDAQTMRRSVDELNAALASLGQDGPGTRSLALQQGGEEAKASVAGQRDKLREDLTAARDAAARRLATAVAALENLRLDLLRLKAGAGSVDELSANLTAARRIAEEIDAQVAGRIEADLLLRGGQT
jgi:serine/threonine-protein kinase